MLRCTLLQAERIAWLGCGAQLPTAVLFPAQAQQPSSSAGGSSGSHAQQQGGAAAAAAEGLEAAAAALVAALSPLLNGGGAVAQRCSEVKMELAGEDGTGEAVRLILAHLEQCQQRQAQQAQQQGARRDSGQLQQQSAEAGAAVNPAARLLSLPNGILVSSLANSETLFIYREIFEQRCYLQVWARCTSKPAGTGRCAV